MGAINGGDGGNDIPQPNDSSGTPHVPSDPGGGTYIYNDPYVVNPSVITPPGLPWGWVVVEFPDNESDPLQPYELINMTATRYYYPNDDRTQAPQVDTGGLARYGAYWYTAVQNEKADQTAEGLEVILYRGDSGKQWTVDHWNDDMWDIVTGWVDGVWTGQLWYKQAPVDNDQCILLPHPRGNPRHFGKGYFHITPNIGDYAWSADSYQGVLTPGDVLTNNRFPAVKGGQDMESSGHDTWTYSEDFNGLPGIKYVRTSSAYSPNVTISQAITGGYTFFSTGNGYATGAGAYVCDICSLDGITSIVHEFVQANSYVKVRAANCSLDLAAPEVSSAGNGKWVFALRYDKGANLFTAWYHTELGGDFTDTAVPSAPVTSLTTISVGGGNDGWNWVIGDTRLFTSALSDDDVAVNLFALKSKYGI